MLLDLLKAPYPSPPFPQVVQVGHDAGNMLSEDEAHHHIRAAFSSISFPLMLLTRYDPDGILFSFDPWL